ncbi:MAG: RIO1 family regulatory kinase/ATPase [Nitrososphaerota archaeon]
MKELKRIASLVGGLSEIEFKVLETIERFADIGRIATPDTIARSLKLGRDYVDRMLEELNRRRLVWSPRGRGREYMLNFTGLDMLALHSVSRRGILTHIGVKIGMGKEADIYLGRTGEGNVVGIKFYRIGRSSIKKHRRLRESSLEAANYLVSSKLAAQREIQALRILYPEGVAVPAPVYRNRHMVVTSIIEGELLVRLDSLSDPEALLQGIVKSIKKALEAGVIHCDLSPYNILVTPGEEHVIIDWPQWVRPSHPNAQDYLRRDVENVAAFFKRRFGVLSSVDELIGWVLRSVGASLTDDQV